MMFWIMLPCNLMVLLIMHFSLQGLGKADGMMILGVKVPVTHHGDLRVHEIVEEYAVKFKKLFWPFMFLQLLGYPLRGWISISLMWTFLYLAIVIGGYSYCIEYYAKKLRTLKKETGWLKDQGHVLNIDTEVCRLQKTFPVSRKWFLLPLFVIMLCTYQTWTLRNEAMFMLVFIIVLSVFLAGITIYEIFIRTASAAHSENTEINLALNKAYKCAWSKYGVGISFSSLLYLPLLLFVEEGQWHGTLYLVVVIGIVVISTVVSLVPMLVIHNNLKKLSAKLLQAQLEELYVDDDEYWTTFGYNNPYDRKVFVQKRIGIGTTINMATTGGKAFMYGLYAFIALTVIWCIVICIPVDFDTVSMTSKEDYFEIGIWGDTCEIYLEEIVSVSYLETFPKSYKKNGSSTSRMKTGTFSVTDYGTSQVYMMVEVPLYIVVELEDESYVFLNGGDEETTRGYYEMLYKD
ncbi:MAG: DUF5808 domain-containing protein [Lachnospiraceae bacterium]